MHHHSLSLVAIRLLARLLSSEFNAVGAVPVVYNTHQAYLLGAEAVLRFELDLARECDFTAAIKLVRGAYRGSEKHSLLQPCKIATDTEYDACARLLLHQIASSPDAREGHGAVDRGECDAVTRGGSGVGTGGAALMLATHNRPSVDAAMRKMEELGLRVGHPRVHLAQAMWREGVG